MQQTALMLVLHGKWPMMQQCMPVMPAGRLQPHAHSMPCLLSVRRQRRLAAATLQSMWRMQLARRQLLVAQAAAVEVQAAWRGHHARLR